MVAKVRLLVVVGSGILLFLFVLFFLGQAADVAEIAENYLPGSRLYVLWGLVGVLAAFLGLPLVLLLRLPAPLLPPSSDEPAQVAAHLQALRKRLRPNPLLADHPLGSQEEIEAALETLAREADELTRETARSVFIVTAVSPNGRFDLLTVLAAQSRLVWRIARLHSQRPALRDLVTLYANVAATSFVAGELDDLDLGELVQPMVAAAAPSASGAIPGMSGIATYAANAIASGAANAYLTLRVGIITRRYCGSLVMPEKALLRRSAMLEAGQLLTGVIGQSAREIVKALAGAATRAGVAGVTKVGGYVKDTSAAAAARVGGYVKETRTSVAGRFRRTPDSPLPEDPEPERS